MAPSFGQDTFFGLLSREFVGTHFKSYDFLIAQKYGPKNIYLLYSLLSGFSLKYNLTASPEMHLSVEYGLKAMCGLKESKVLVVRTCIQLLLDGFRLTKSLTWVGSTKKQLWNWRPRRRRRREGSTCDWSIGSALFIFCGKEKGTNLEGNIAQDWACRNWSPAGERTWWCLVPPFSIKVMNLWTCRSGFVFNTSKQRLKPSALNAHSAFTTVTLYKSLALQNS